MGIFDFCEACRASNSAPPAELEGSEESPIISPPLENNPDPPYSPWYPGYRPAPYGYEKPQGGGVMVLPEPQIHQEGALYPCPQCDSRDFTVTLERHILCSLCGFDTFLYLPQYQTIKTQNRANSVDSGADEGKEPSLAELIAEQERAKEEKQLESFRNGYAWIMAHLAKLQAAGWTRQRLFTRSRYRYPLCWGLAWQQVWARADLHVQVGQRGQVVFTFPSGSRSITQTAWPAPPHIQR